MPACACLVLLNCISRVRVRYGTVLDSTETVLYSSTWQIGPDPTHVDELVLFRSAISNLALNPKRMRRAQQSRIAWGNLRRSLAVCPIASATQGALPTARRWTDLTFTQQPYRTLPYLVLKMKYTGMHVSWCASQAKAKHCPSQSQDVRLR